MKALGLLILLACVSQAPASDLAHVRTEFHISVNLPYAEAAPLFGAWAEQKWAPDWKPQFIYPSPPADREGAVFKVEHGSYSSIWITSVFDLANGHIQYVYLLNMALMTRIDIHLKSEAASRTAVSVIYERTALDPAANEHATHMATSDSQQAPKWQAALDAYAAKQSR